MAVSPELSDRLRARTRRDVLERVTSPLARVAQVASPSRLVPRGDLVNVLEFEEQARRVLPAEVFAAIARGDRASFDRITLRPRMCVPTTDLDLGVTLFNDRHFAPIVVGPVADQTQFHSEGERATLHGAAAAKAVVVLGASTREPIESLAASTTSSVWFQVYASDMNRASRPADDDPIVRSHRAAAAGCRAICVTVGAPERRTPLTQKDWLALSTSKLAMRVPVVAKGIVTADEARRALATGVDGLIVSTNGGPSPLLSLASIVDVVAGNVPVLVDGGFARGSDVIKALAFGAAAVLVARPVMWGLAAYGADGVQAVLEMLQTELARFMAMSGKVNVGTLGRDLVRVHAR